MPTETTLTLDDEGRVEVLDGAGEVRALIATPYAVDSTPDELTGSGRWTSKVNTSWAPPKTAVPP